MAWYQDLDVLYTRYDAIFERVLRERDEAQGRRRENSGGGSMSEDWEGMFSEFVDAPKRSFGDFMQG